MENRHVKRAITSEDVLGIDVIDSQGKYLGVSDKLYINPQTLKVVGISVDKGFMRKGFLIGADHIKEVTEYAIFLTIEPAFRLKGMSVFGVNGEKIGKVKEVVLVENTNDIEEIVVRTLLRNIRVQAKYVAKMENSIFLNITKEELIKIHKKRKS